MEVEGSWCILCAGMDSEADEEGDTTGENAVAVGTAASAAAVEQRTAVVVFMVHVCAEQGGGQGRAADAHNQDMSSINGF